MCIDEAGVLRSDRVVLSRPSSLLRPPPTASRLPDPFPGSPVIGGHAPPAADPGVKEALSSSHDNLLTVPRPPRRRVLRHPLQDRRWLPWPSPFHQGLGSLLFLLTEVSVTTLTDFASCCGPASRSPPHRDFVAPLRQRALTRRREPCYQGPWHLPGPDSHRLAVVNLSLGYVITTPFLMTAPELLDARWNPNPRL